MKFQITTAGTACSKKDAEHLEKLGFKFRPVEINNTILFYFETSVVEIEIPTLEALIDLIQEYGEIIMGKEFIELYDDYIE